MAVPARVAPVLLFVASALFAVAALAPTAKGAALNPAFLTLTIVFAILGGVTLRKSRGKG